MEESDSSKNRVPEHVLLSVLERVNRAMLAAPSIDPMLTRVLDEILMSLDCDRAWLLFPCDPDADGFTVQMERTVPEWPGANAAGVKVPMEPFVREAMASALREPGARRWDAVHRDVPRDALLERFAVRSMMFIAVRPRSGPAWCLGIHHCGAPRVYSDADAGLFEAIAARLADGLTGLLAYQSSLADRRRLEHAQHLARVGSYEHNRDGETYWSKELYSLLGLEPGTRPKRFSTVIECIHPEDRPRAQQIVGRAMQQGGEYSIQVRAVRPGGEEWVMQASGHATLGTDGSLLSMMGVAQDITERVRAEEQRRSLEAQLRQSQKMESIGQLTGGVAHDFNNLLTIIMGSLSELSRILVDAPPIALELIEQANAGANRAADLTRMLTAFSRRQPLRPQVVDANGLLRKFENLLRRTLGETVEIETILSGALWSCEVDPAQLESALLNLALNARDAMPTGGKITIATSNAELDEDDASQHEDARAGQFVRIVVKDTGRGMPEEVLGRAFEPFFTTKEPGRGTGLGLSMVYGFVTQSGGHVRLQSTPGEGTTAAIYLPRSLPTSAAASASSHSALAAAGGGELLLVVEDEADVRAVTVRILEHLGYRVLVAEDAAAALRCLDSNPDVDLLFTDVVLPGGMNGAELAEKVRERRPQLPVLFTSGYTQDAIIHHGRLDEGVRLVEKPFTRATLARNIREALADGG